MTMKRREILRLAGAAMASSALHPFSMLHASPPVKRPLIFAHRGASALRPEHTLASYAKAIADGADCIEPDLVRTRDGVLIVRHEINLADSTDVARHAAFADRRKRISVDGEMVEGWFVQDFTLKEIKTLRAIERLPHLRPANMVFDGRFDIPTFEEVISFVAAQAATSGRLIGIAPELKHSAHHAALGLPLEDAFLRILAAHDYMRRAPVFIQSFEVNNLRFLRERLAPATYPHIRLMQLIGEIAMAGRAAGAPDYAMMQTPAGLKIIRGYADYIAPYKAAVLPGDIAATPGKTTRLVADAHDAGLGVVPFTFRPENAGLLPAFRNGEGEGYNPSGAAAELRAFAAAGVDGLFTDDPGFALQILQ